MHPEQLAETTSYCWVAIVISMMTIYLFIQSRIEHRLKVDQQPFTIYMHRNICNAYAMEEHSSLAQNSLKSYSAC